MRVTSSELTFLVSNRVERDIFLCISVSEILWNFSTRKHYFAFSGEGLFTFVTVTLGIEVRFSFQIEYQCCHCCQYLILYIFFSMFYFYFNYHFLYYLAYL